MIFALRSWASDTSRCDNKCSRRYMIRAFSPIFTRETNASSHDCRRLFYTQRNSTNNEVQSSCPLPSVYGADRNLLTDFTVHFTYYLALSTQICTMPNASDNLHEPLTCHFKPMIYFHSHTGLKPSLCCSLAGFLSQILR